MSQAKLFVVDDDETARALLAEALVKEGYEVEAFASGQAAVERGKQIPPDVVLTDIRMEQGDGFLVLKEFKRFSPDTSIVLLTAFGSLEGAIEAIKQGAYDYLAKPFNPRELLARIRALLRRTTQSIPENGMAATTDYRFGIFRLDLAGRRLLRGNEEVHLTSGEFDLLSAFTKRPNRVLSRDQLIELLKGYDRDAFDRSIDIRITRLRHKIENDPSSPIHIRTVRGEGYLFNPAN